MKILIASLQVSYSASKGHLHPAIELALETKRLGHEPFLLTLPSPLGAEDEAQVRKAGIAYFTPPHLPADVIKSPEELATLAANKDNVWKAYHSFLVAPLLFQYQGVLETIDRLRPDVLIYDLLVYSAPLAARALKIPDIGFCAGLKLIAPEKFQTTYSTISARLKDDLCAFLESVSAKAMFKHLELLSPHAQVVFTTEKMIGNGCRFPERTHLVGPIHPSAERSDVPDRTDTKPKGNFAILSFGSVLDPADFPKATQAIINTTADCGIELLIGSKKLKTEATHVSVTPYLPLAKLLPNTSAFFHHGGASSFSEAILAGAPQILIPLTTDQPIQAYFLDHSDVGFTLSQLEANGSRLKPLLMRMLDRTDDAHRRILEARDDYRSMRGQKGAIELAVRIAEKGSL